MHEQSIIQSYLPDIQQINLAHLQLLHSIARAEPEASRIISNGLPDRLLDKLAQLPLSELQARVGSVTVLLAQLRSPVLEAILRGDHSAEHYMLASAIAKAGLEEGVKCQL